MLDEVLTISLQSEAQISAVMLPARSEMADDHLVRAAINGDEQAFAELFERYKLLVTRVVSRFFRDRSEIEECVQQSFAKSYFSLKNFRGGRGASFPAWITRISVNVCYDEFRRRQRKSADLFTEMDGNDQSFAESVSDKTAVSAESTLSNADLADKILSSLDARDRIAMTLVYTEDYSLQEAAEIVGISASNLKSRLFRCRTHIRNRFGHLFT